MATPRVSNAGSRSYVQDRLAFRNHNDTMWGVYRTDRYTVYSYRADWPLFIAVQPIAGGEVLWFENSSKYSVTTSRHRSQAHPLCPTTFLSREDMVTLDRRGYRDFMAVRLNADPRQTEFHREHA